MDRQQAWASRRRARFDTKGRHLRPVLALATHAYALNPAGIHGPFHWMRVLRNGRELAARTPGADLVVVEHFALLHDCQRQDDGADFQHGERAADYVRSIGDKLDPTPAQLVTLADACSGHEWGETTNDPTIGCCWDADRLELSRLHRRPDPDLLSTHAALLAEVQGPAWQRGINQTRESL